MFLAPNLHSKLLQFQQYLCVGKYVATYKQTKLSIDWFLWFIYQLQYTTTLSQTFTSFNLFNSFFAWINKWTEMYTIEILSFRDKWKSTNAKLIASYLNEMSQRIVRNECIGQLYWWFKSLQCNINMKPKITKKSSSVTIEASPLRCCPVWNGFFYAV